MRTQVKICGLTCEEDARAAVEAGAEAVGIVFWPGSPCHVEPSLARRIAAVAGTAAEKVGVFANEEVARVRFCMADAGLDVAQLNGGEEPEYGRALGLEWYRVFRIGPGVEPAALFEDVRRFGNEVFMLDTRTQDRPGRSFDWRLATKVSMRASLSGGQRMVLAGGLSPENVAEAIRQVRPWRVDVSRGVEGAPGRKDPDRIRDFIAAVREVG